MTDIRQRLADALGREIDKYDDSDAADETRWQTAYRQVDALLSLPGIAIVELPEPETADVIGVEYWDCDGEQDNEMHLTVAVPEDFGPNDWQVHNSPAGKRKLAAALLAAADKAEQSDV